MPSRRPPEETEAQICARLVKALYVGGWSVVDKTHGDAISAGWPDLYCYHRVRQLHRWIEVKRPSRRGKAACFEPAQLARFGRWQAAGLGVYVLCDTDLSILFKEPNWRGWL